METIEQATKKYCDENLKSNPQLHLAISTAFEAGVEWMLRQQKYKKSKK